MKRLAIISLVILVIISISACGKTSDFTVDEIITNAIHESAEMKSFHLDMVIDQNTILESGETIDNIIRIYMNFALDPIEIFQHLEIDNAGYVLEMFMTPEGSYIKDTSINKWLGIPSEMYVEMIEETDKNYSAAASMNRLAYFAKDITLEQTKSLYILRMDVLGDGYKDLIKDSLEVNVPEGMTREEFFDNVELKSLTMMMHIDKTSFYVIKHNIETHITIKLDGAKMQNTQKVTMEYSEFNKLDAIMVPVEVVQEAARNSLF